MGRIIVFAAIVLTGCGPSKHDKAQSQVETIARKEFNDQNFRNEGATGEIDPWGKEIKWSLSKGMLDYTLEIRSNGPDRLPYTHDDVMAKSSWHIPKSGEKNAEAFSRGLGRGFVEGIKDGISGKEK